MANPNTATAMVQILKKQNFEIPLDDSTSKRCGVDFLNIKVPKEARIKRVRRKREKGKGNGKKSPGHEKAKFLTKDEAGKTVGATEEHFLTYQI